MTIDLSSANSTSRKFLNWIPVWHLGLSALVAACLAVLVYVFWFPAPYHQMSGGMHLFWWMLAVDAVCGPLLTWLLIRPGKSKKALATDLMLIACLQLGALAYGLYTLAQARPLALVFEVDRFRVITYADVPESELTREAATEWFTPWSLDAPRTLGLTKLEGLGSKMSSVEAALLGVDAAQRPSRWQDYTLSRSEVLERTQPLSALRARYPMHLDQIDAAAGSALPSPELRWLPLVGRQAANWVALVDPSSAAIVGYLPLDGFF